MTRPRTLEKESGIDPSMTLVSVRVPTSDLEALRLAAMATGGTVAELIRRGIQMELADLRTDSKFREEIRARRDELNRLVDDLDAATPTPATSRG